MSYLVDANVLCEATRPEPQVRVLAWLTENDAELHISTLTLAEILRGIHLMSAGRKQRSLEKWYEELRDSFSGKILPFDEAAAENWGSFYARNERSGRLLSSFDSLLAATALAYKLTIATRNVVDFPAEVPTVNPWNFQA